MLVRTLLILISSVALLASEPGLAVRFSQADRTDLNTIPFPALHVPAGQSPALRLTPGPFTAEITGFISVDLRAQHRFTVEHTGEVELLINGKPLLKTPKAERVTQQTSDPIRLSKGENALLIRYTSPSSGAATFRLLWSSKTTAVPIPIPASALSHTPSPELTASLSAHRGAFHFDQFQCARCHAPAAPNSSPFDAPSFAEIGSRLNPDYIAAKILNPSADRPSRMPKIFHGAESNQNARAIAAYLVTLSTDPQPVKTALPAAGATLVSALNCRACHTLPTEPTSADRIALAHVAKKFQPAALVAYLQNPRAHYPGNPMPDFKLLRTEAESIAAFLIEKSEKPKPLTAPETKLVTTGQELVQTSGCLNCHALDLPNKFKVPATVELFSTKPDQGCLAPNPARAPQFAFADSDRADLTAFLATFKPSEAITRIPAEFAVEATDFLRCHQCHTDNQLPAPLTLGGKLKPEWTAHFIAGENLQKPRPWLKARMPAFPAYATNLAVGLAALHGYPAQTPAETSPAPDLIKTGETLIGSTGGFSCVACHAVGASSVQLIVESPGVNLAYSGERLLPDYFRRWLMNPIAIDPSTKMPAYFDAEGRSQLTEFFEGDAHQQIDAMWHYIRSLSK